MLSREECLQLLASHNFGRLAVAMNSPVIRPVNYVFDERSQSVAFRTANGSKFDGMLINGNAAFEIDGIDAGSHTGWSVIILGMAEEVTGASELRRSTAGTRVVGAGTQGALDADSGLDRVRPLDRSSGSTT